MGRKEGRSTQEALTRMVMSFRVHELQTLLASCGRSRYGRKHELHGRAKSLLRSAEGPVMRERVKSKILELYNQKHEKGAVPATNDKGNKPVPPASIATTYLNSQSYLPGYHDEENIQPTDKSRYITQSNYKTASRAMHSATVVHPNVRFISLPFYELVDILVKPTTLQPRTTIGYQEANLVYHLTPYQTQFISTSGSYHINSMIESSVQVQLRFCLNETSCVQEDLYPTRCKIVVNGKGMSLPGQPPPNIQNQEPKKPHRPINITSFCRLSPPMQSNEIQVHWMPCDLGQQYTATVQLVKSVRVQTLIERLTKKPIRSEQHTTSFIKIKLSPDADNEVAMTSLKVSLCCPIGRTRMSMPCRAKNCNHLQCFDGSTYIQMNEHKPSWVCPVCDQKAYYEDIFQDGLFTSIIDEVTNCEDIVFFKDGSWRPLEDIQREKDSCKPPTEVLNTPKSSANKSQSFIGRDSPPVLSINSPEICTVASPAPQTTLNLPTMPTLELRPIVHGVTNSEQSQTPDDDVEIIMIDDSDSDSNSDSDSEDTVGNKTNNSSDIVQRFHTAESSITTTLTPFSDPDLQGLELYDPDIEGLYTLLPDEGSTNVDNSQQCRLFDNIIDITDEE